MPDQLQLRGGTTAQNDAFTGAAREVTVDTTKDTLVVHDASTAGGNPLLREDGANSELILGSAATPSLKFTGDTNTGIFSPGADQVAVSTGGTERVEFGASEVVFNDGGANYDFRIEGDTNTALFFVDASADAVGVGTTSPTFPLQVETTATGTTAGSNGVMLVQSQASGRDAHIRFGDSVNSTARVGYLSNSLYAYVNGQERLRITSAGRVGIGTSSPVSTLDTVCASGNFNTTYNSLAGVGLHIRSNGTNGNNNYGGGISFSEVAGAGAQKMAGIASVQTGGDSNQVGLAFFTHPSSIGANNLEEKLRITAAGNVGIGTTSFAVARVGILANTNAEALSLISRPSDNQCELHFRNSADTATLARISTVGGNNFAVQTGGTEAFRVDSSQRFLVGTSTTLSTTLLQVEGKSNDGTAHGGILLRRGSAPGTNDALGYVLFGDNNSNAPIEIGGFRDGGTWTGGSSMPTRLVFSTTADGASSPTERMRIQSDGRILAGTTAPFGSGGLTFLPNYSNGAAALYWNRANTTTQSTVLVFRNNNTNVGSIYYTNTATTYATTSDYRLKENVALISDGIDRLKQLKPSRFNFIVDPDKIVDGFLAHEVQDIVPEAIGGTKDEVDDEGNPVYQNIDQSKLVPLLTAALQEAIAKIETLEAKVSALEAN